MTGRPDVSGACRLQPVRAFSIMKLVVERVTTMGVT
jgi:hypothetical protein